ncbi:hypothetical protein HCN44_011163 [Aphidius gifuensis]|uniref:TATA-box-binding protein n=1 Tax=Aphidius gifuensis TaxID=684658 RepID=A0A834XZ95_APHGI|nr:TATA-box-binding protein-like [Aphidius gifuensis]KAF7993894.1 hypothetical protein HCN44_011163 [Aphidius gifuensis]
MMTTCQSDNELKKLLHSPAKSSNYDKLSMAPPLSTNVPRPSTSQNTNPQLLMTPLAPVGAPPKDEPPEPVVQNVVSTINLGCELDLMKIYARVRAAEYNPARFTGLVMKIISPKTTALIFRSGKMVCTGSRSENDSFLAARKFARIIQKIGFPVKFLDFKIQNMVATCDLKFPIKIEDFTSSHNNFCSYEPELYPGVIYRLVKPRVVLLIFVNGKIVVTGAKTRDDIQNALHQIYRSLKTYRKY